jgi:hypothetical protein
MHLGVRHEENGAWYKHAVTIKPGEVYDSRSKSRSDSRPGVSKPCSSGSRPRIRQRPGKRAMQRQLLTRDEAGRVTEYGKVDGVVLQR